MTDRVLFLICDGWALGHDANQWTLLKAKKRRDERYWNAVSFIASNKTVLRRVLREKRILPTAEAQEYLDTMPESFTEWQQWWLTANQRKPEPNLPEIWVAIEAAG